VLIDKPRREDLMDGSVHVHTRPVHWIPLLDRFLPMLGESWCLARALRELHGEHRFDIVEFPNWEGAALVATIWNFIPVVVRLHTTMAESLEVQRRKPRAGERFMLWAERESARRARAVVTHSRAHLERVARSYRLAGIHLIPHGIRLPPERSEEPPARSVLARNRVTPRKGGRTLLEAIPRVLAEVPEAKFTVIGADETDAMVREFRVAKGRLPEGSVNFIRFVEYGDLAAYYKDSMVYASAAVYESFGLTLVEAMAHSVPVVGCATSAIQEVIQDEQTGLLVPPNDPAQFAAAIVRLIKDKPLRERLGSQGRRMAVEKYGAERMARAIEEWFAEVLARDPDRTR
jgi:glycosyltransferase involved in cell wall biosynthesis